MKENAPLHLDVHDPIEGFSVHKAEKGRRVSQMNRHSRLRSRGPKGARDSTACSIVKVISIAPKLAGGLRGGIDEGRPASSRSHRTASPPHNPRTRGAARPRRDSASTESRPCGRAQSLDRISHQTDCARRLRSLRTARSVAPVSDYPRVRKPPDRISQTERVDRGQVKSKENRRSRPLSVRCWCRKDQQLTARPKHRLALRLVTFHAGGCPNSGGNVDPSASRPAEKAKPRILYAIPESHEAR
jgi:hypothetical protein